MTFYLFVILCCVGCFIGNVSDHFNEFSYIPCSLYNGIWERNIYYTFYFMLFCDEFIMNAVMNDHWIVCILLPRLINSDECIFSDNVQICHIRNCFSLFIQF